MLIIRKFPKTIAGRTKFLRGPRVWDPWPKTWTFDRQYDI